MNGVVHYPIKFMEKIKYVIYQGGPYNNKKVEAAMSGGVLFDLDIPFQVNEKHFVARYKFIAILEDTIYYEYIDSKELEAA